MGRPDHHPERVVTTARRCLLAIGTVVMTYAVIGALTDPDVKLGALIFLIGVLVAHDGLLLPLTIGAGILAGRYAPRRVQALIRAALLVSLAVTIVAFPLVLGRGRTADNPSLLPLHYGRGLLEIYAIVWATAAAAGSVQAWRHRRRQAAPPDHEPATTATP
jgi:hypothetical protein